MEQPVGDAGAAAGTDLDPAEVERRRKQRDLKRKSRERKKVRMSKWVRNLQELQTTAHALELEYKQLIAARLMREQEQNELQGQGGENSEEKSELTATEIEQTRLVDLQEKYKAVRQVMHELRDQMTGFKLKLEEYERFIAMLDGHLMGFEDTQTDTQTRQGETTS
ncbi:hypothetical protein BBJ28_00022048 [Nothophytophthora sp. Chile5]|nr:hypothetical protein BBJ28_00022048 [Nothophytophthora sp. Chile5]